MALFAAAAWIAFCYRRDGTRPRIGVKALMGFLRLAAMVLLGVLIAQPMLRTERVETTRSVVALLIDESKSMGLQDRWGQDPRARDLVQALSDPKAPSMIRAEVLSRLLSHRDSATLRALMKTHDLRVYRFGSSVSGSQVSEQVNVAAGAVGRESLPLAAGQPDAEQTRIGTALDYVLQDTSGQPLSAVVLLSDGGQNVGEDPAGAADRLRDVGARLLTVGFGNPRPPQDVAVTSLLADEVVRKGDEVVVSIGVRQRGYGGGKAALTLSLDGKVLKRAPVSLNPKADKQEITLSFTPNEPGAKTLLVSVEGQPGEVTLANNRRSWPIRIIDKKLKVLYVEGRPRWEFRYLKNAIVRDPTTLFSCILTDADPSLGGEGNVPIYGFPKTKEALYQFDILILGDVPRSFFTGSEMKNIRGFVEERGGSLITIAGEVSLPWEYRDTDLESVWPIVVPPTRREILFEEPFQLSLTDAGARHPMMLLRPDIAENQALWKALPGMFWCGVADRAKPGATVLARHPRQNGSDGKIPLLAVQQVGEGQSFMSMVDSTWQWRYRVGDKYFYRFWGQVVRSLTPHELPGANRFLRLSADRTTYSLGERVVLRARLLTRNFLPVRRPEVTAEMEREDGQRFPVRLEPVPGAPGVYAGEWLPPQPGSYRGLIRGADGQRGESLTRVVVEASSIELEHPEQDEALLRRLATQTGGKYFLLSEFDQLPQHAPDRRTEFRTPLERPLWGSTLPIALFGLLLTVEWLLRKKNGLL